MTGRGFPTINVPVPGNPGAAYAVRVPRRFILWRDFDVSGISGTGAVAEGVEFSDGTCVVRWITGKHRSTVVWASVDDVEAIHGHGGATRIVWDTSLFPASEGQS